MENQQKLPVCPGRLQCYLKATKTVCLNNHDSKNHYLQEVSIDAIVSNNVDSNTSESSDNPIKSTSEIACTDSRNKLARSADAENEKCLSYENTYGLKSISQIASTGCRSKSTRSVDSENEEKLTYENTCGLISTSSMRDNSDQCIHSEDFVKDLIEELIKASNELDCECKEVVADYNENNEKESVRSLTTELKDDPNIHFEDNTIKDERHIGKFCSLPKKSINNGNCRGIEAREGKFDAFLKPLEHTDTGKVKKAKPKCKHVHNRALRSGLRPDRSHHSKLIIPDLKYKLSEDQQDTVSYSDDKTKPAFSYHGTYKSVIPECSSIESDKTEIEQFQIQSTENLKNSKSIQEKKVKITDANNVTLSNISSSEYIRNKTKIRYDIIFGNIENYDSTAVPEEEPIIVPKRKKLYSAVSARNSKESANNIDKPVTINKSCKVPPPPKKESINPELVENVLNKIITTIPPCQRQKSFQKESPKKEKKIDVQLDRDNFEDIFKRDSSIDIVPIIESLINEILKNESLPSNEETPLIKENVTIKTHKDYTFKEECTYSKNTNLSETILSGDGGVELNKPKIKVSNNVVHRQINELSKTDCHVKRATLKSDNMLTESPKNKNVAESQEPPNVINECGERMMSKIPIFRDRKRLQKLRDRWIFTSSEPKMCGCKSSYESAVKLFFGIADANSEDKSCIKDKIEISKTEIKSCVSKICECKIVNNSDQASIEALLHKIEEKLSHVKIKSSISRTCECTILNDSNLSRNKSLYVDTDTETQHETCDLNVAKSLNMSEESIMEYFDTANTELIQNIDTRSLEICYCKSSSDSELSVIDKKSNKQKERKDDAIRCFSEESDESCFEYCNDIKKLKNISDQEQLCSASKVSDCVCQSNDEEGGNIAIEIDREIVKNCSLLEVCDCQSDDSSTLNSKINLNNSSQNIQNSLNHSNMCEVCDCESSDEPDSSNVNVFSNEKTEEEKPQIQKYSSVDICECENLSKVELSHVDKQTNKNLTKEDSVLEIKNDSVPEILECESSDYNNFSNYKLMGNGLEEEDSQNIYKQINAEEICGCNSLNNNIENAKTEILCQYATENTTDSTNNAKTNEDEFGRYEIFSTVANNKKLKSTQYDLVLELSHNSIPTQTDNLISTKNSVETNCSLSEELDNQKCFMYIPRNSNCLSKKPFAIMRNNLQVVSVAQCITPPVILINQLDDLYENFNIERAYQSNQYSQLQFNRSFRRKSI